MRIRLIFTYITIPILLLIAFFFTLGFNPYPTEDIQEIGIRSIIIGSRDQEVQLITLMTSLGLNPTLGISNSAILFSDTYQAGIRPLEQVLTLGMNDPRITPYVGLLKRFFTGDEGLYYRVFFPGELLNSGVLRILEANFPEAEFPKPMEKVFPQWIQIVFLIGGLIMLTSLLWDQKSRVPGFVSGALVLVASLGTDGSWLFTFWVLAFFWALFCSRFTQSLGDSILGENWFKLRHYSVDILAAGLLKKSFFRLSREMKILFAFSLLHFFILITLQISSGVFYWGRWLVVLFGGFLIIVVHVGFLIARLQRQEHRLFHFNNFYDVKSMIYPRVVVLFLLVTAWLIGYIGINTQVSHQDGSHLFAEELHLELAARHDFYQNWFGFGARYDLIEPGYRIEVNRFPRNGLGYSHEIQLISDYDVWIDEWKPGNQDPAFLFHSLEDSPEIRVVQTSALEVYSQPRGSRLFFIQALMFGMPALIVLFGNPKNRGKRSRLRNLFATSRGLGS